MTQEALTIKEALHIRSLLKKIDCRTERSIIDNVLRGEYDQYPEPEVIANEDLNFLKSQAKQS